MLRNTTLDRLSNGLQFAFRRTDGAALIGFCLGVVVVGGVHLLVANAGTSLPVVTSAVVVASLACAVSAWIVRRPRGIAARGPGLLLTGWIVLMPMLAEAALSVVGALPISGRLLPFVFGTGVGLVTLGVPLFLIAFIINALLTGADQSDTTSHLHRVSFLMASIGAGIIAAALFLAPTIGVQVASLGSVACATLLTIRFRRRLPTDEGTSRIESAESVTTSAMADVGTLAGLVASGLGCGIAVEMLMELVPGTEALLLVSIGALTIGCAAGLRFASRYHARGEIVSATIAAVALVVWIAGLQAVYPMAVRGLLLANATVSNTVAMMAIRAGLIAIGVIPCGVAMGALIGNAAARHRHVYFPDVRASLLFAAGFLIARWGYIHLNQLLPVVLLMSALTAPIVVMLFRAGPTSTSRPRLPQIACVMAVAATCVMPWAAERRDPTASARLLFSTNVAMASRADVSPEMLSVLDESRVVDSAVGERGTLTLWRSRVAQLRIRENGVPRAVTTSQPDLCPHYSTEVTAALVPLVLHPAPEKVLILGLGGGVATSTSMAFPVQSVTCAESDSALVELVGKQFQEQPNADPFRDDRFRLLSLDPALAVAARGPAYDVIVSTPAPSSLTRSVAELTSTFYRRAARRLASGGVFCQRFRNIDYGPQPLAHLTATVRCAFRNVMALQVANGDVLLIATNAADGFSTDGLDRRLQHEHVRALLAQVAWDWSSPLALAFIDNDSLAEFADDANASINSSDNGLLAFSLPIEEMRWGNKQQELRDATEMYTRTLATLIETEEGRREALARISEMNEQHELIAGFADEPWVYRSTLRSRLKNKPRPPVDVVRNGKITRKRHPTDQRRLDYFKTLAKAVAEPDAPADRIADVADFALPFDPILGHFVHHEVAELYAKLDDEVPDAEYAHRLHSIFYSQMSDRSIRNIIGAVHVLVENPDIVAQEADRWDHLNALLQMLAIRWQTRRNVTPRSSRVAMNDIRKSMDAVEAAFRSFDAWAPHAGVSPGVADTRRRYLEKHLVRPLRTYRSQLLTHLNRHDKSGDSPFENVPAPLAN